MSARKLLICAFFAAAFASAQAQIALDRPARFLASPPPAQAVVLADGFDFPLGKPDAQGYYKARGFRLGIHPGEDWNGRGGGNSDLDDAVNSIANGVVVYARDAGLGWGNVVIVRHQFREKDGVVNTVDAFFAHLNIVFVRTGEAIVRGQQIGSVGTAHGRYLAHLHFELRKNVAIGINRAAYPCDFSCYYDPTRFIAAHRPQGRMSETVGLLACNHALQFPSETHAPAPRPVATGVRLNRAAALAY